MRDEVLIDCTFCGDKQVPSAREDVVPRWLARKLAHYAQQRHPDTPTDYKSYGYEHLDDFMVGNSSSERSTGAIPARFHLPDVCGPCNREWMGRLEQGAGLVMTGFLVGEQKLLAPYDQFVLAMWAVKTSLAFDASQTIRLISEEFGTRDLYRRTYPLPGAQVLIGHDPNHVPEGSFTHGRRQINGAWLGSTFDVHAATFTFQFDCLLFQTTINYGLDVLDHKEWATWFPANPPYFHQVWPPVERFLWPSGAALIPPV